MNRYLYILIIWLCSLPAFSVSDDGVAGNPIAFSSTDPDGSTDGNVTVASTSDTWTWHSASGTSDGTTFPGYWQGATNPTYTTGSMPTAGCTMNFTPSVSGRLSVYIVVNADKAIYVVENDTEIDYTLDGTSMSPGSTVSEKATCIPVTFEVTAGNSYAVFCKGSKMGYYGYNLVPSGNYQLIVESSPANSGSLNTTGGTYAANTSVNLSASNSGNFYFKYWKDSNGDILSTSNAFTYTMPEHDVTVTAVYTYSPDNPALPDLPTDNDNVIPVTAGNTGEYTSWWLATSGSYTIKDGEHKVFGFYNYTNQEQNYYNWMLVTNVTGTKYGDSDYSEYALWRADNYGWGTYYDYSLLTNNYNWNTFKSDMNGAYVTVEVGLTSGVIHAYAVVTTSEGNKYVYTMKSKNIGSVDAIDMFFAADYSYLSQQTPKEVENLGKHKLVVNDSPALGNVNTEGGSYKAGTTVNLAAYGETNYQFMYWIDGDGNVLSKSSSFDYTMPDKDAVVTAVYKYVPDNPSLPDFPEEEEKSYTLTLTTKPAGAGSFNSDSFSLTANTSEHLYAYNKTNFYFQRWEDKDGKVISTAQNFYYTMPAEDTQLYAIYTYNPVNPSNPGKNSYDCNTGEVIVDDFTAGSLSSAINEVTDGNTSEITKITVAGKINSNDFSIANNYSSCAIVDLSRTSGVTTVPDYCYSGNTNLNCIYLPSCITTIESGAFKNATSLMGLTCYATVPPTLENEVFLGVTNGLIVYVPVSAVELYENASGWKEYEADGTITIMPIRDEVSSLGVNLPAVCADGRYKNMPLELLNVKSGQKYKYVVTDRINYVFNNLIHGTKYVATLKNLSGAVLAKSDTISIENENVNYDFILDDMKQLRSVTASVVTPSGDDVTSQVTVNWFDEKGTFLSQDASLFGQVAESKVKCSITMTQSLGTEYILPKDSVYEVVEDSNSLVFTLAALPTFTISGNVTDKTTDQAVMGASVTVSQTLNGQYSKSLTTKTDSKGHYTIEAFVAPTTVTFAASDYINQTETLSDEMLKQSEATLDTIKLKPISGATISTSFTFTTSVADTAEPETQSYYSDYNNVDYTIYNETAQKAISQFSVQYPSIVLLEEVNVNDSLTITAKSKKLAFKDIVTGGRIDESNHMSVTIPVVQWGGINSSFTSTENSGVIGVLYDADDKLVKKYTYSSATLSINNLKDGEYTLVTMGESDFFGSIYDLNKMAEAGLQQNVDYVLNKVTVQTGVITTIKNVLVPFFDESKFYYTGDNTSFTVNKTSVIAGNYLTLTAKVDFKDLYKNSVSDESLVVDLPEGTTFVENSVLVGSTTAYYEKNGNTLTIPNIKTDRVRFCIVPSKTGTFAPSASVAFKLAGKSMSQPIGSVGYTVKGVTISVPSVTAGKSFTVKGTANSRSSISVYDDNTLIGETKALATGAWSAVVQLDNPYNLSTHNIYAKIVTTDGAEVNTETKTCTYDRNAVKVKTVTMINTAHTAANLNLYDYVTVFDFQNPATKVKSYWYWPNYPKFTFLVDLTDNDPERIHYVYLKVKTSDNGYRTLETTYNKKQNKWIAVDDFNSSALPVNVSVAMDFDAVIEDDSLKYIDFQNDITALIQDAEDEVEEKNNEIDDIVYYINKKALDDARKRAEERRKKNNNNQPMDEDLYRKLVDATDDTDIINLVDISTINLVKNISTTTGRHFEGIFTDSITSVSADIPLTDIKDLSGQNIKVTFDVPEGAEIPYQDQINSIKDYTVENPLDQQLGVCKMEDSQGRVITIDYSAQMPNTDVGEISHEEFVDMINDQQSIGDKAINCIRENREDVYNLGFTFIDGGLDMQAAALREEGFNELINNIYVNKETSTYAFGGTHKYYEISEAEKKVNVRKGVSKCAGTLVSGYYTFTTTRNNIKSAMNGDAKWERIIGNLYTLCDHDAAEELEKEARAYQKDYRGKCWKVMGLNSALALGGAAGAGCTGMSFGLSLSVTLVCIAASSQVEKYEAQIREENKRNYYNLKKKAASLDCKPFPPDDGGNGDDDDDGYDWDDYPGDGPDHVMDPSGYVYEGVSSNRMEGVTTTAYYKETVEDMYGDLHENIVLWNAEEYAQQNPLFTDENGLYQWDVPDGLWRVKYEKEGYVTTYSDWLPVPPPQLDINIGMVQNAQPEVTKAKAYEDGVEIEFSKYMNLESLNSDNLYVKVVKDDQETLIKDATIEFLDKEDAISGSKTAYATKVKLATDTLGYFDEAYVIVSKAVNSYAGISMAQTFEQKLDVEKKVCTLLVDSVFNVAYEDSVEVTIAAIPADVAAGKTITITSASDMIAKTDITQARFDADGQVKFKISGELLGTTAINYSIEDAELTASSIINVLDPSKLNAVKAPVASRVSGTAVYRGQTVTLTCESDGATIYYTTDGSCPCDETSRIKYENPITINDAMTLKIMAIGTNFDESDVNTYSYTIRQSDVKLNLSKGWNWGSHDVASPVDVNEFSGVAKRILTQTKEAIDDPVLGMVGTLTTIDGGEAIKVEMKEDVQKTFTGDQYNPTMTPITLHSGWNWLGYPVSQTMTVSDALSYLDVEDGDYIESLGGGFATYSGESGEWVGDLQTMEPGSGYLYKSASDKSFIYNLVPAVSSAKALFGHRLNVTPSPWTVDTHSYPDMMPVVAQVCYADGTAVDSTYYVAAFSGDECRGVGTYKNNILYLSVYGEKSSDLTFKAYNTESKCMFDFSESLSFHADAVGSLSAPYRLVISGDPTGISSASGSSSAAGAVYNLQGVRVKSAKQKGIYIINTTDSDGNSQLKKQYVK